MSGYQGPHRRRDISRIDLPSDDGSPFAVLIQPTPHQRVRETLRAARVLLPPGELTPMARFAAVRALFRGQP